MGYNESEFESEFPKKEARPVLHTFSLNALPRISAIYRIERQTVWQTCDQENILVLMERGRCLFRIEGEEYEAQPGDLIFIPAGQEYQRRPLDGAPAVFYYFHFSLNSPPQPRSARELGQEWMERQALEYRSAEPGGRAQDLTVCLGARTALPPEGQSIAGASLEEYERGALEGRLFYTLHFSHLLALATRETARELLSQKALAAEADIPLKLRAAILFIRSHYDRGITVGEVCRQAGLSRQHLIRLFKQELNVTPIQYINRTRIMHAKDLLWRNINLSVKELAYELGFADEHYFSRLFTRVVGEPPSAFRDRMRAFSSDSSMPE